MFSIRARLLGWVLAASCAGCAAAAARTAASSAGELDADLRDQLAIRDLVARLSDALNHQDWAAAGSLLTEGAVWEALPPIGWTLEGRDAIVRFLSENTSNVELLSYDLFATAVHLESRTSASARSTMNELLRLKKTDTALRIAGTYVDRFEKGADGRWRFSRRTFRVRYEDDVPLPKRLHGEGGTNAPSATKAD